MTSPGVENRPAEIIGPARFMRHSGFFVLVLTLLTTAVSAAESQFPLESVDTSSPRSTLKSFLDGMHEAHLIVTDTGRLSSGPEHMAIKNRVLRCLDASQLAPAVRMSLTKEASVCLKEVLDRIELPPESEWPNAVEVTEQQITKWTIPHTEISIVRIKDGTREGEFLFSSETVERATEFYAIVKSRDYLTRDSTTPGFYERFVSEPGWMIPGHVLPLWSRTRWYGQATWQWAGLVASLALALTLMVVIYMVGQRRAAGLRSSAGRYSMTLVFPISAMFVPLVARYFIMEQLHIYGYLVVTLSFTLQVIFLFAMTFVVVSIGSRLAELIIATPWIQPAGLDAQLVQLTCRVLSLIGATIVLLEGGQQLGLSLATLFAGAGVGGLAIALAAQDSLKNILGSMMIMLDQPFKVGEKVIAKGYEGVVEDIGLRSTKMRLTTGHQVSIPNEEMARAEIENIGRRPFIRQSITIELPSDTSATKSRSALEVLRGILVNHEGMTEDRPPQVRLRDINPSSIGINVSYWYHPPEPARFVAFNEIVLLQILEQFEAEGILFAAPARNIQVASDTKARKEPS
jgi:MscS family membrane protein